MVYFVYLSMPVFSIVVICKNEEHVIEMLLKSVSALSDDLVVYDTGSTDNTPQLALKYNANLYSGPWEGYGKTRVTAALKAKHDWILILDADEALDSEARFALNNLDLTDNSKVYQFRFRSFLGDRPIHYGEWGNEKHIKLFNRTMINCDMAVVHERLILSSRMKVHTVPGYVLHYSIHDIQDYCDKMQRYAWLWAEKNAFNKSRYPAFKMFFSPTYTFLYNYILRLGIIDGREGFICASMTAYYTFLKYTRLMEIQRTLAALPHPSLG